ncbi:Uncharacterized protein SCG7109_AJ_00210 [Chlamydiales bacterium SCGC AG-110-M15]|nr:Uncharacterized protein SCG7109_AJ_00210 [Chlamydiales bacterium SCGC AG-110-M15]
MATIRERSTKNGKPHFHVIVRVKGYPVQRQTFSNKTKAKQWAQEMEVAIRSGKHVSPTGRRNRTVDDMIDRYLEKNLKKNNRQYKTKIGHLRWWKNELGAYALNRLSPSILVECREKLLAERIQKKPRTVATVNRYLATFSLVLNTACIEWEWLDDSPMKKVKKYKEPRGRIRYLDEEEKFRLLDACKQSSNSQLYIIVMLALSTGMRLGEILNLTWTDVDLEAGKAVLHETKNGERRVVPIVSFALELLRKHKDMQKANTLLVFPNERGSGHVKIRKNWERAMKEAVVENFRFHDLRHTFASYLAMNGASLAELAEALGHKTLAMVKRYAHLSEAHTAGVVQRMNDRMLADEKVLEA